MHTYVNNMAYFQLQSLNHSLSPASLFCVLSSSLLSPPPFSLPSKKKLSSDPERENKIRRRRTTRTYIYTRIHTYEGRFNLTLATHGSAQASTAGFLARTASRPAVLSLATHVLHTYIHSWHEPAALARSAFCPMSMDANAQSWQRNAQWSMTVTSQCFHHGTARLAWFDLAWPEALEKKWHESGAAEL